MLFIKDVKDFFLTFVEFKGELREPDDCFFIFFRVICDFFYSAGSCVRCKKKAECFSFSSSGDVDIDFIIFWLHVNDFNTFFSDFDDVVDFCFDLFDIDDSPKRFLNEFVVLSLFIIWLFINKEDESIWSETVCCEENRIR